MRVGIISGGQLARMLALSSYPLGLTFSFYDPSADACAGDLGPLVQGSYSDKDQLKRFADGVDVVTCEFENVPAETLEILSHYAPVLPHPEVYRITQDRITEKELFTRLNIPVPAFRAVSTVEELRSAVAEIGLPAVLKTRRLGYDGKGQAVLTDAAEVDAGWKAIGEAPAIVEAKVQFVREISQVAARNAAGEIVCYEPAENMHRSGILRVSTAPAGLATGGEPPTSVKEQAAEYTRRILTELRYVGVIAVEFFQSEDTLYANEIAPRVHNTGHWTIEGATTSQFQNHIRAVCGLPLGSTERVGFARMFNLIGSHPPKEALLQIPEAHLHLYRKGAAPGRKIGHVTVVSPTPERLEEVSQRVVRCLGEHF